MLHKLQRGTQIIYVPMHAKGDVTHKDCEMGFVDYVRGGLVFCRYWNKDGSLRTTLNAEQTPLEHIVIRDSVPQSKVDNAIVWIDEQKVRLRELWGGTL